MSIFTAPKGSPSSKPAMVKQYPDMPERGGMKRTSVMKNDLAVRRPAVAGTRSSVRQ